MLQAFLICENSEHTSISSSKHTSMRPIEN
jgi:hypothetical protein